MYGLKKVNFLYLILLAIVASGFFVLHTAKAYNYNLGASRKYYSGDSAYIVGTGNKSGYEKSYFTGLGYCTGYYYVNHNTNIIAHNHDNISTARQVFDYDESNIIFGGDYINSKLTPTSTAWTANYSFLGNDFRFDINRLDTNAPYIPKTYTLGRFWIKNFNPILDTTVYLKYLGTKSFSGSTFIDHTASTFDSDADMDYNFDIKYYAQPCVPDTPITTNDVFEINGDADGNRKLAKVPAFHGQHSTLSGGRPVTAGSSDLSNTGFFLPGQRNTSSFQNHITFDSGIYINGIKEPDLNSQGPVAFHQKYGYNSTSLTGSTFGLLTSDFVDSSNLTTTNQRGINPDTIKVYVTFTGVNKTNFGDAGQYCTVVISGEDLGLEGLGDFSWNRNELGYSVNITSGTIRSLAKAQCSSQFSSVAEENIDLKRETVASISWDAWDYANSMIISQEHNTEEYRGANRITGVTGYNFNQYSSKPNLSLHTGTFASKFGVNITGYNIHVNTIQFYLSGMDDYAGINSGSTKFYIVMTGWESSQKRSDKWKLGNTHTYVFSGSDLNLSAINQPNLSRYRYTGYIDIFNKISGVVNGNTGMNFELYFYAEDFVGNSIGHKYIFRTPTWPNAPKSDGSLNKIAQTKSPINQINIIDNIKQDTQADSDGSDTYAYTTYYPSSSGLIADFAYISGSQNLTGNQALVLTATNGNAVGATVVTMTGLVFNYHDYSSFITGTLNVSSGGLPMNDYLATNFTFSILATNIYGITGIITYNITVSPSCTESPGCTDPVYVFWGTNLANAQSQQQAAINSGTDYLKANHWYPHWFAEIKQTGPNFYFTGVDSDPNAKVLYCASTGNQLLINYDEYSGPQSNSLSVSSQTFTGSTLIVSGSVVNLFDNLAFPVELKANYVTVPDNGNEKMTIYVNRPLTGRVFYSVCEFTGTASNDVFGCPVAGNYTGNVNWTILTSSDQFVMTGWIEGGWFTGSRNGYVTGGSLINGDQFDFWSTGTVSNGGGTRKYVRTITGDLDQEINTSGSVSFNITNRTGSTTTVSHEIYWIDNTSPNLTGYISSSVANKSANLTLSGYNTGVLSTSFTNNLIGDDEYIVTKFSGDAEPSIFENGYGSTMHTGQWYINGSGSEYKMMHTVTFAQDWEGQICVEDRAGNESCIDVEVAGIGLHQDLTITVRPAFRPDPATSDTGYAILSGDFWFWVKSGTEWTQNYNSAINTGTNPKITTSPYGTGIVSLMTPASGTEYLVVFKGSGTLSAGFTGIWRDDISEFNFFSGTYADNFNTEFVYKYVTGSDTEWYLKVGDVSVNGTGDYDSIVSADFSLINNNLTVGVFNSPIRYDFDINYVISSMEQSMILQAWGSHGFIGWLENQTIISMTGFINL